MHLYPATSSMQVPWFRHGLEAHSLILVWQFGPAGPKLNTLQSQTGVHGSHNSLQNILTAQILTSEAHATIANISAGHVFAGTSIHARVGLTLIIIDIAVFAAPAGVTKAFIAGREKILS